MSNNSATRTYDILLKADHKPVSEIDLFPTDSMFLSKGRTIMMLKKILPEGEYLEIRNGKWRLIKQCPDFQTRAVVFEIKFYSAIILLFIFLNTVMNIILLTTTAIVPKQPQVNITLDSKMFTEKSVDHVD